MSNMTEDDLIEFLRTGNLLHILAANHLKSYQQQMRAKDETFQRIGDLAAQIWAESRGTVRKDGHSNWHLQFVATKGKVKGRVSESRYSGNIPPITFAGGEFREIPIRPLAIREDGIEPLSPVSLEQRPPPVEEDDKGNVDSQQADGEKILPRNDIVRSDREANIMRLMNNLKRPLWHEVRDRERIFTQLEGVVRRFMESLE